jgi:restriction system protein
MISRRFEMTSDAASVPEQAFSELRQIVDQRLEDVQADLASAVERERYERAQKLARWAQELAELCAELDSLAERVEHLLAATSTSGATGGGRLPKGLKTSQSQYRIPILQTLVEMGGQADIKQVLERVRERMSEKFNEYDLATLSDGETPRWRNTAQWARNAMREEGLIRDDTARGTWAISEKGRNWLEKHTDQ